MDNLKNGLMTSNRLLGQELVGVDIKSDSGAGDWGLERYWVLSLSILKRGLSGPLILWEIMVIKFFLTCKVCLDPVFFFFWCIVLIQYWINFANFDMWLYSWKYRMVRGRKHLFIYFLFFLEEIVIVWERGGILAKLLVVLRYKIIVLKIC